MRLALLSDQHANDVAFRAALEHVEQLGVDEIVCLGDVAQGGAQPAQTLDRLAALGCETVLGNADALLLEVPTDSPEPVTERHLEVREWTLSQLDASHLEQIRSFAPVVRRELEGTSLLFFHGSPRSYDDVLLPEVGREAVDRHREPVVLRALAEWALVTIADGSVAVEFRQVPYSAEEVRAATKRSGRSHADEWAEQWG